MRNPVGIQYDSMILNRKEELIVERMSATIMEFGQPTHGDMKNDPIVPANSVFEFVAGWQGVFPNIGQKVAFSRKYAFTPMWGSLNSLSSLRGGIAFLVAKHKDKLPDEVKLVLQAFEDLLVNEANEVGSGTQVFVAERYEPTQK